MSLFSSTVVSFAAAVSVSTIGVASSLKLSAAVSSSAAISVFVSEGSISSSNRVVSSGSFSLASSPIGSSVTVTSVKSPSLGVVVVVESRFWGAKTSSYAFVTYYVDVANAAMPTNVLNSLFIYFCPFNYYI